MDSALRALALCCCALPLFVQAQQLAPASPPAAGLETSWEIAPAIEAIGAHAQRLLPALDRVDARAWVNQGASETYLEQLDASKQQARALADGAKALARNPERLSVGLVVLFRIQGIENMLGSLEEGLRKYQNPAEAQKLATLEAENGANRDRLEAYLVSLAAAQEQQYQVMDREAQRCRGVQSIPAPPGRKK